MPSLHGKKIGILESRRAKELAALAEKLGGEAVSAPTVRETPAHDSTEVLWQGRSAERRREFLRGTHEEKARLLCERLRALLSQ